MGMGCFHFWVTVSNDAMNMGVQTSDQIPAVIPYGYRPRNGSAGHTAPDFFALTLVFWCPTPVCIPVFERRKSHTPDMSSSLFHRQTC